MILNLWGKPKSCMRPKFSRFGTYDPQAQEKRDSRKELLQQFHQEPFEGPIQIQLFFNFSPPKGVAKKRINSYYDGEVEYTKKPDIDNLIKYVLDVMNKTVFRDDAQVTDIIAKKSYTRTEGTVIILENKEHQDATD